MDHYGTRSRHTRIVYGTQVRESISETTGNVHRFLIARFLLFEEQGFLFCTWVYFLLAIRLFQLPCVENCVAIHVRPRTSVAEERQRRTEDTSVYAMSSNPRRGEHERERTLR